MENKVNYKDKKYKGVKWGSMYVPNLIKHPIENETRVEVSGDSGMGTITDSVQLKHDWQYYIDLDNGQKIGVLDCHIVCAFPKKTVVISNEVTKV